MEMRKILRKNIFGGLNRKDVEEYVASLERELENEKSKKGKELSEEDKMVIDASIQEIQRLKDERDEMRKQISELQKQSEQSSAEDKTDEPYSGRETYECLTMLEKENRELREKLEKVEGSKKQLAEDQGTITRALCDAKAKADQVLKEANDEAHKIVTIAEYEMEERKKRADKEIRKELQEKVAAVEQMRGQFAEYAKGIEEMRCRVVHLSESLQLISDNLPERIMEMLNGSEEKLILDAKYTEIEGASAENEMSEESNSKNIDVRFQP